MAYLVSTFEGIFISHPLCGWSFNSRISRLLVAVSIWRDRPEHLDKAPLRCTIRPGSLMAIRAIATLPLLSGFTKRFDFNRVNPCQPYCRTHFRLARPLYQLSKHTDLGLNPPNADFYSSYHCAWLSLS